MTSNERNTGFPVPIAYPLSFDPIKTKKKNAEKNAAKSFTWRSYPDKNKKKTASKIVSK